MAPPPRLTKDCPQCHAPLALHTDVCVCGYRYDATLRPTTAQPASSLLAQAEELYETHLRARLMRAQRGMKLAKVDLLRDPANPAKRAHVREAEKEVHQLETQLAVQAARVADARAAAERPQEETANAAAPAPETFRAAQSIQAQKSFELFNLELAAGGPHGIGQGRGVFKAHQAQKAEEALRTAVTDTRLCPGCGIPVAAGVARCDCGYRLDAAGDDGPFLSDEEFAALRGNR